MPEIYTKHQHKLPKTFFSKSACQVVQTLVDNHFEAYLVGGCIRDGLSTVAAKDHDIVTNASPVQIKKLFKRSRIIGKRFRIVHVQIQNEMIEVSTFRAQESWWHAVLAFWLKKPSYLNNTYGTIETDAWRRDFSANALYYDVTKQTIIDFTGGYEAIRAKKLCIIGNPITRFNQDPVRILRAIRFVAKTQFSMDKALEDAICDKASSIASVSADRLLLEVVKLFYHGHGDRSLMLLKKYNVLSILYPGYAKIKNKEQMYMQFLKAALCSSDRRYHQGKNLSTGFLLAVLLWPIMFHTLPKPMHKIRLHEFIKYAKKICTEQRKVVAVTKKLQEIILEIWVMQYQMQTTVSTKMHNLEQHPRINAAYDFLSIRAQVDESLANLTLKWHNILLSV